MSHNTDRRLGSQVSPVTDYSSVKYASTRNNTKAVWARTACATASFRTAPSVQLGHKVEGGRRAVARAAGAHHGRLSPVNAARSEAAVNLPDSRLRLLPGRTR